jgi:hypothetical protein
MSTGYALANPGREYIVHQPTAGNAPFDVQLPTGNYDVEWFSVNGRQAEASDAIAVDRQGRVSFGAPFATNGPTVLYLERRW